MFQKFCHVLLIVALVAAVGGHWAVLQTVAWTNMLAENLQTNSLSTAMEKTFDGKHPCSLCKAISAGKKSEKKSELPPQVTKFEFVSERPQFVFSAPQAFRLMPESKTAAPAFSTRPPVPPPRSLFA